MAFEAVLAVASVYAMTSHEEGFSMVLVEALTKGVPLVSMDCARMGAAALQDARQYSLEAVSRRWEDLFEQLLVARTAAR